MLDLSESLENRVKLNTLLLLLSAMFKKNMNSRTKHISGDEKEHVGQLIAGRQLKFSKHMSWDSKH